MSLFPASWRTAWAWPPATCLRSHACSFLTQAARPDVVHPGADLPQAVKRRVRHTHLAAGLADARAGLRLPRGERDLLVRESSLRHPDALPLPKPARNPAVRTDRLQGSGPGGPDRGADAGDAAGRHGVAAGAGEPWRDAGRPRHGAGVGLHLGAWHLRVGAPLAGGDEVLTRSALARPGLAPADVMGNSACTEAVRAILARIRSEGLRPVTKTEPTA